MGREMAEERAKWSEIVGGKRKEEGVKEASGSENEQMRERERV